MQSRTPASPTIAGGVLSPGRRRFGSRPRDAAAGDDETKAGKPPALIRKRSLPPIRLQASRRAGRARPCRIASGPLR